MKKLVSVFTLTVAICSNVYSQNSYPLYSSGSTSGGGSGDFTNIIGAQLKLQSPSGYIRVPHLSTDGSVSTVYNYETGKNVYWGEPADAGIYLFRGRHFMVTEGNVGIGTLPGAVKLRVSGPASGSGVTLFADGGGDVMLNGVGTLFFDGNYSYAAGNYIRPLAANTQGFFTSGQERI